MSVGAFHDELVRRQPRGFERSTRPVAGWRQVVRRPRLCVTVLRELEQDYGRGPRLASRLTNKCLTLREVRSSTRHQGRPILVSVTKRGS